MLFDPGMELFHMWVLLGVEEHEVQKQSSRANDVASLGEQRYVAIS